MQCGEVASDAMRVSNGMSAWIVCVACAACGGGEATPAKTPESTNAGPVATPEPAASNAGQPQVDSGAPPLQGTFVSAVRAANSSKEDKIGEKDGNFKPDGVKDLVFDVEFKGPAAAFIVASVDAEGTPTGEWDADSLAGKEIFPGEILHARDERDVNGGIVLYEDGKILNKPDGGITPFGDESHKLQMRISVKKANKGPVRIFAMLTDRSIVTGPVIAAGK